MNHYPTNQEKDSAAIDTLGLFEKVREPLALLNEHLTVVKANAPFLHMMDMASNDVHGYSLLALKNGVLATPTLKEALHEALATGKSFGDIIIDKEWLRQRHRIILASGHIIEQDHKNQQSLLLNFGERTGRIDQQGGGP